MTVLRFAVFAPAFNDAVDNGGTVCHESGLVAPRPHAFSLR